ncbi:MAG: alkane 1-monooxygenase [Woeseiaceae bacterium]|nr:alkane 1-monooxygenase [Woeseiaceae bacterium]
MKSYTATASDGRAIDFVDRKRGLWLLSVLFPLQPFPGIFLHASTGNEAWLLLPFITSFVLMPLLDALIGEDRNNPPEAVVPRLNADPYYLRLLRLVVPLHFVALIGTAWWAGSQDLSIWAFVGLAAVAGMTSGLGINTGHELGHKTSRTDRWLARIVLAVPAYGHFTIDHNRGHHSEVATPEDPASARMGESIYRFAGREIPGAFRRAWRYEAERLQRKGLSPLSRHNEILQSLALALLLQAFLVVWLGPSMIPFLVIHNLFAWWQLTSANYVEHYGLLRRRQNNGRPEPCRPHHSWNSNHALSNLVLFHLQRHSDHHAHPARPFQSLRHFDDLPTLPSGYFGSYLLAWCPWLWFRVMDPKLIALPHVGGRLDRVNVDPRRRAYLEARFGRA